jgi:hypothetical protein
MQSLERSSVHYHMKQIHFARDILKLDGANASIIAKRVGRSPRTVRKWMREGIPKSAQEDCLKAVKRHNAAVKAASSRSSVIGSQSEKKRSDRKPTTDNRKPKKSARIPPKPVRGKPQKDIGHRTSAVSQKKTAVSQKRTKPVSTLSGRKPTAERRRPSAASRKPTAERRPPSGSGRSPKPEARWLEGTFVPLTEREKGQQREQLVMGLREAERISGILEHIKVLELANQVRKSGVNGMRRVFRLHGKNKNHRKTLYEMIDNEDEAWIKFSEMCEEMGMSEFEIRSSWFSPK